jgi:hypothetical protein
VLQHDAALFYNFHTTILVLVYIYTSLAFLQFTNYMFYCRAGGDSVAVDAALIFLPQPELHKIYAAPQRYK